MAHAIKDPSITQRKIGLDHPFGQMISTEFTAKTQRTQSNSLFFYRFPLRSLRLCGDINFMNYHELPVLGELMINAEKSKDSTAGF
jgi:hypothetical protein